MSFEEDYELLGIDPKMSFEEKRKKYHESISKYHPDIAGKESEELVKELNNAWERIEKFHEKEKAIVLRKDEMISLANEYREMALIKESVREELLSIINKKRYEKIREEKWRQKKTTPRKIFIPVFLLIFFSVLSTVFSINAYTLPVSIAVISAIAYFTVDAYWRYIEKIEDINNDADQKIRQVHRVTLDKGKIYEIHEKLIEAYNRNGAISKDDMIRFICRHLDRNIFQDDDIFRYAEYIFYTLIEKGYVGRLYYENDERYIPIPSK